MTRIVEVEVIDIRAGGVLVKMEDGRTGFIRRRELSWEQRIALRPDLPEVGEQLKAKIISDGEDGNYTQLSVRQITEPWKNARGKYAINDVVRGEVVNIRDFGVFVQLEPGIYAIIWPRYLPLLRDQLSQDILAVGDQVQGVLLNIDWSKRQMELSINHRLEQVSRAIQDRKLPQVELFREKLDEQPDDSAIQKSAPNSSNQKPSRRYHPPLPELKRILIVDDTPADRMYIAQTLKKERELTFESASDGDKTLVKRPLILDEAHDGQSALEKITGEPNYDLVILDLTLENENGVDVAKQLLDQQPDLSILFTSNNPLVDEHQLVIRSHKYPFATKEREDLVVWIDNLYGGYWETVDQVDAPIIMSGGSFIRQLGMATITRRPLTEVLTELLARLRKETGITHAMVLEVDVAKESVWVTAVDPTLDDSVLTHRIDALYFSPVQNVVKNNAIDYRKYIPIERPQSLRNFFPLLDYQTFLGLPLIIPDMPTRYALFLLDEYRPEMSSEVQEQGHLLAQLIQIALERNLLLDFMYRYEQRYALGQLLGSLVHEFTNKMDTLKTVDNLAEMLEKAETSSDAKARNSWLQKGRRATDRIARAKQDLHELVTSYSRLAGGNFKPVDINEAVQKIARQLTKRAKEVQTSITVNLAHDLPPARAIQPRLEQVITNVVLNAIQQIDQKRRQMSEVAHERNKTAVCQQSAVYIQTRYRQTSVHPIEIIIIDSGPGISAYRHEEIFLLDTSGRKTGHGLGLYISRSLMETMGGRLKLMDSVLFLGSAFVIVLSEFLKEETE